MSLLPRTTYAALLQRPPVRNKGKIPQSLLKSVIKLPDSIIRVSALASVASSSKNQSLPGNLEDVTMGTESETLIKNEHVTHRYNTCLLTLLKMLEQLHAVTGKVQSVYRQTSQSIAVFRDYCNHLTGACVIDCGTVGSLQLSLTATPTTLTTVAQIPSFLVLADSIIKFCKTAIPISNNNQRISSRTYLPEFLQGLNKKCENVLEETISFIRAISVCNGTTGSNIQTQLVLARASNVQLPEYVKGIHAEQWKNKSPQEIYLEMEMHISQLNYVYQNLQRSIIEIMKYVADVVSPTAEELYNMMQH
jgi:hypothetical protein